MGIDGWFYTKLYWLYDLLPMGGLKLIHVSEKATEHMLHLTAKCKRQFLGGMLRILKWFAKVISDIHLLKNEQTIYTKSTPILCHIESFIRNWKLPQTNKWAIFDAKSQLQCFVTAPNQWTDIQELLFVRDWNTAAFVIWSGMRNTCILNILLRHNEGCYSINVLIILS